MNKEDIIMNAVFLSIIALSVLMSIHMVNKGIEPGTDPYWPETFPPDPEPDWEDSDEWHEMWYNKLDTNSNGEVDTEEYHGKEGKSEYGEYEYNKWMELQ